MQCLKTGVFYTIYCAKHSYLALNFGIIWYDLQLSKSCRFCASPSILTDHLDLRTILADYWMIWISKNLTQITENWLKINWLLRICQKFNNGLLRTGYPHSGPHKRFCKVQNSETEFITLDIFSGSVYFSICMMLFCASTCYIKAQRLM